LGIVKASCCVNFSHEKTTKNSTIHYKTLEKFREAIKGKRPEQLTPGVRLQQVEPNLTLQPRQWPDCKSGSGKFYCIHHTVLI
jgi:hypothetical protein